MTNWICVTNILHTNVFAYGAVTSPGFVERGEGKMPAGGLRHDGFECIKTLVWAIQAISVFLSTTHLILTQFRLEYCFRS